MSSGIDLEGFQEILNNLENMGRKGLIIENNAIKKGGKVLKDEAEKEAPRSQTSRKTHLQDNIVESNVKRKGTEKWVEVGANKAAFWDKFEEFGTSQQPPQAWLDPSYQKKTDDIMQVIAKEIIKNL